MTGIEGTQEQRRRALSSLAGEGTSRNLLRTTSGAAAIYVFEIYTARNGHFNGRTYAIRCVTEEECDEWIAKIEQERGNAGEREEAAHKRSQAMERWAAVQGVCARVYNWRVLQGIMAVLVIINFIVAIAEAELVPEDDSAELTYFYNAEIAFTSAFAAELLLNMVGHWFKPFWDDPWNVFDFFIVLSSIIVIPLSNLPGFNILRLFRVFRIMRLFRWMKALRVLMKALAASVVPVLNAFAILSIITCLYAVIGVQLFGKKTPDRFDKFSTAFFTMVQVCTGDGWAEAVARPMWDDYKGPQVSLFFVTYILIAGTFLLNIVVAVLLDEFITSVENDKQQPIEEARLANEEQFFKNESPLDPLVSTLTRYTSNEDLDKQIQDIFELLDPAEKGAITFKELQDGLRRLPFEPPIVLTADDFEEITHHHQLCLNSGQVDAASFTAIMRTQLRRFVQKFLNLKCTDNSQDNTWLILSLKQMLLSGEGTSKAREREERMERMLVDLHCDMAAVKEALNIPLTQEQTPMGGHTPVGGWREKLQQMGLLKSSFKSGASSHDFNGFTPSQLGSSVELRGVDGFADAGAMPRVGSGGRRDSVASRESRLSNASLDSVQEKDIEPERHRPPALDHLHKHDLSFRQSRKKVTIEADNNGDRETPVRHPVQIEPTSSKKNLLLPMPELAQRHSLDAPGPTPKQTLLEPPRLSDPLPLTSASLLGGSPGNGDPAGHVPHHTLPPPMAFIQRRESDGQDAAEESGAEEPTHTRDREVPIHRPPSRLSESGAARARGDALAESTAAMEPPAGLQAGEHARLQPPPADAVHGEAAQRPGWQSGAMSKSKSDMMSQSLFDKRFGDLWEETREPTVVSTSSTPSVGAVSAQLVVNSGVADAEYDRGPALV